jgi:hypothetical protein
MKHHTPIHAFHLLILLLIGSTLSNAATLSYSYTNADLNGDAMVTSQDISIVLSCFGQDPASNDDRAKADVDKDGDIDRDDFSYVSARLGQTYPWRLYPLSSFQTGGEPRSVTLGDVNNDSVLDMIVANSLDDDVSVMLGNGDGSFQVQ